MMILVVIFLLMIYLLRLLDTGFYGNGCVTDGLYGKCFTIMFGYNPIVGTYCPGVRVGNWFEDIALEEVGGYNTIVVIRESGLTIIELELEPLS